MAKKLSHKESFLNFLKVKYLFGGSLIIGSLTILSGIFHHYNFLTILFIIAIMFIYFFLGKKQLANELLSIEQFADSNYYLGFLFTLMSLGASLFILSNGSVNANIFVDLIGQFGLSISTTIIGLSMRIYLTSFSPTMDSNIDNFNTIIFERLTLLRDHINETIDQTKIFSSVIDEKINMFVESTEKNIEQYNKRIYDVFDEEVTKNIFVNIANNIEELQTKQEKGFNDLYGNIQEVHKTLTEEQKLRQESLINTIDESKIWIDKFSEEIKDVNSNINNTTNQINSSEIKLAEIVLSLPATFEEIKNSLITSNEGLLLLIKENNQIVLDKYLTSSQNEKSDIMDKLIGISSNLEETHKQSSTGFKELSKVAEKSNQKLVESITVNLSQLIEKYNASDALSLENTQKILDLHINNSDQLEKIIINEEKYYKVFHDEIAINFNGSLKELLENNSKINEKLIGALSNTLDESNKRLLEALEETVKKSFDNNKEIIEESKNILQNISKQKDDKNSFSFWK